MTVGIRSRSALIRNYREQITANMSDALDGLLIVFNNQRDDEIATNSTHHKNRVGFNKADANILSVVAKSYLDGKELDDTQCIEVKKRMPKYARQIVKTKIKSGKYVKQGGVYLSV